MSAGGGVSVTLIRQKLKTLKVRNGRVGCCLGAETVFWWLQRIEYPMLGCHWKYLDVQEK